MNAWGHDWRFRVIAVVALIALYFVAWNPIRSVVAQQLAGPIIGVADGASAEPGPHPAVVHFAGEERRFVAPGGLPFLIGAIVLLAAAPRVRYLVALLIAHLILGAASAIALAAYLRGAAWGGFVQDLIMWYLVDAVTLVTMVLAVTVLRVPLSVPPRKPVPPSEESGDMRPARMPER